MTKAEAYQDLIVFFCGSPFPGSIPDDIERLGKLPEDIYENLQNFVASKVRLQWLTGIGVLEAIEHMVDESIANSSEAFERAKPFHDINQYSVKKKKWK